MAGRSINRGFSLLELVTVLVVVGILAAVAVPRLSDTQIYDQLGLYDNTRAILRYAQKSAIATRRVVCVTFTLTSATLTVAQTAGSFNCGANNLTGPSGENPYTITAKSSATYAPAPADFNFNPLGQPVDAAGSLLPTQTISIADGVSSIVVEADTGYVH